jgi:hypothetical protein
MSTSKPGCTVAAAEKEEFTFGGFVKKYSTCSICSHPEDEHLESEHVVMSSKDDADSILYSNLNWCDVTCGFTRKAMGVLPLIGKFFCWPG